MLQSGRRDQVGNYRLQYDLGRGQQGVVFCAKNVLSGEDFAIKLVSLEQLETLDAIEKEVNIHKMMKHPNIVQYIESL